MKAERGLPRSPGRVENEAVSESPAGDPSPTAAPPSPSILSPHDPAVRALGESGGSGLALPNLRPHPPPPRPSGSGSLSPGEWFGARPCTCALPGGAARVERHRGSRPRYAPGIL